PDEERKAPDVDTNLFADDRIVIPTAQAQDLAGPIGDHREVVSRAPPELTLPPLGDSRSPLRLSRPVLDEQPWRIGGHRKGRAPEEQKTDQPADRTPHSFLVRHPGRAACISGRIRAGIRGAAVFGMSWFRHRTGSIS